MCVFYLETFCFQLAMRHALLSQPVIAPNTVFSVGADRCHDARKVVENVVLVSAQHENVHPLTKHWLDLHAFEYDFHVMAFGKKAIEREDQLLVALSNGRQFAPEL